VITYLQRQAGLSKNTIVADIGSGTGIFTKHLLDTADKVYAIEPNTEMRAAADVMLKDYPNYISLGASASQTGLNDHSVNLIVCAQAFHWFNTPEAKAEFKRILKDTGYVSLIWNNRVTDVDDFSKAYDKLLREKTADYNEVNHQKLAPTDFRAFYKDKKYEKVIFPSFQEFDEEGYIGRANSSSYVPVGDETFLQHLKDIFRQYQQNGKVKFHYNTEVYLGQV
jgi:ubiquinone/menaquinone biosynthesis C-methylase UbiE